MHAHNTIPIQQGQQAVVVGAGRSGMAAVRLLVHQGIKVRLLEQNATSLDAATLQALQEAHVELVLGSHNATHFTDATLVIPSPGIPVADILPLLPTQNPPLVLAEIEYASRFLSDESIIAITGTGGKTTTATLTAAMLEAAGMTVFLGGNIGTPLSEYILNAKKAQVLVLEISSFQLQTCTHFHPHVAILLNITENHLDYHKDMDEYCNAKWQIFRKQNAKDTAIIHTSLAAMVEKHPVEATVIWLDQAQQRFTKHALFGKHNDTNMEAAWLAASTFGVSLEAAAIGVANVKPLVHRLESVRELHNVLYVNDSKCTTVASLRVALEAFDRPIILLAGGKFKGGDLHALRPLIQKHVKSVILFGDSQQYFTEAWEDIIPITWLPSLAPALSQAKTQATSGDVVLLAPATASFDLYTNYMARGDDFKKLVGALQ